MKKFLNLAVASAIALTAVAVSQSASAQMAPMQFIGNDNFGNPICNGPRGVAPCAVIQQWLMNGGMSQPVFQPVPFQPGPVFQPAPAPAPVNNGGGGGGGGGINLPTIDDVVKTVGVVASIASFF